jgi:hypothetical protein
VKSVIGIGCREQERILIIRTFPLWESRNAVQIRITTRSSDVLIFFMIPSADAVIARECAALKSNLLSN